MQPKLMTPSASPESVHQFLLRLGGPYHIACRGKWTPCTFEEPYQAAEYACRQNDAGRCVYYAGNHPKTPWAKGGRRSTNIRSCVGSWIDIDNPDPEIGSQLIGHLKYQPSYVAFTGGGFQAFWRYDFPTANCDRARSASVWLQDEFRDLRPDATQSAEHLFRLPGTRNRKPGRADALVELIYSNWENRLPLDQVPEAITEVRRPVIVMDIGEWSPPHGELPDRHLPRKAVELLDCCSDRFPSRSEHEWAFICACADGFTKPEIILHYLTRYVGVDDDDRIGHRAHWQRIGNRHVPRRSPEAHAQKQIARALARGGRDGEE